MSVASEIERIKNAKADIKASLEAKGVTVGDGTIDTYASAIDSIEVGGGDISDYFTTEVTSSNQGSFSGNFIKKVPTITINSNVYQLINTFRDIRGIKELNIINKSDKLMDTTRMFSNSTELQKININGDLKSKNTAYMFYYCSKLKSVPEFDTSESTSMENMFYYCQELTEVPFYNTSNVTNFYNVFNYCKKLTKIPPLDTSKATNISYMFYGCSGLTEVPLLDTSKATNISYMFDGCSLLETIPLFDFSSATKFTGNMFGSCKNLKTIPQIDTTKFETFNYWFTSCTNLESVPKLNASGCIQISGMFANGTKTKFTDFGGLENLGMAYLTTVSANYGNYKLDLSLCTALTEQSLINVLTNLFDIKTKGCKVQTITFGSTNLAKLTSVEGQTALTQAQNYGWTIN